MYDREIFPAYKELQDVMAFFTSFQCVCEEMGVCPQHLVDLVGTLSMARASDYEHFKEKVKQHFALTSEHYRKAFRKVDRGLWQNSLYEVAAQLCTLKCGLGEKRLTPTRSCRNYSYWNNL